MESKIPVVEVKLGFKWQGLLIAVIVGLGIWLIPTPEGLSAKAWGMLALFVATIVAIIAKAMPMGAATLVALVISGLTGLTPISPKQGDVGMLSGFANGTIWLIAIAMFLSRAVIKTGLGKRIALYFVGRFGKKMMGVAYGMALADVVIGPGIPSASARGGGIMYPIMQSIADAYESKPGPTARRAGAFLAIAVSQIDTIICTMFLTAMAGNPLIAELAKSQGVEITWMTWFLGAIVPGIVSLIVLPYFVYLIYPPELKDTPKMAEMARWDTMFWFAVLVMMANALNKYGAITWISTHISSSVGGFSWPVAFTILVLVYFYTRYFFASAMAHISAMYLAFVAAAIAVGTPPIIAAIGLGYTSTLSMSLTQYAGGPGPALYGSGYNSTGQWWGVSFIVSILSLVIWFGVGGLWMKLLGWW
ncbi:MAG: SLC13 family permease [Haemophilus parainfluenzae]|nr:SLC13 family permease [Haemophilus parainfluenzae]